MRTVSFMAVVLVGFTAPRISTIPLSLRYLGVRALSYFTNGLLIVGVIHPLSEISMRPLSISTSPFHLTARALERESSSVPLPMMRA